MNSDAKTPDAYIDSLPAERKEAMAALRRAIKTHLPEGFQETMNYGMIGYVVPHKLYPDGYHCDPKLPLPFLSIASQKNYIAMYHSGLYSDKELLDWFVAEYPKHTTLKLDMGKSCVRFKKADAIPFALIEELSSKMSVREWVELYEKNIKKV